MPHERWAPIDVTNRPNILSAMKRCIRARCGYGCVVCGCPIYDHHHIDGFDPSRGHHEDEITLLCPTCHRKEQAGVLSREQVIQADREPSNWRRGQSAPEQVWYATERISLHLGSITAVALPGFATDVLVIDGRPVFGVSYEDGAWLLSLEVRDPWHRPLVVIEANRLVYAVGDFDITFSNGRLIVGNPHDSPLFAARFQPPTLTIDSAWLFWNGIAIGVRDGAFVVLNPGTVVVEGVKLCFCATAISLGRQRPGSGAALSFDAKRRLVPVTTNDRWDGWREVDESEIEMFPEDDSISADE